LVPNRLLDLFTCRFHVGACRAWLFLQSCKALSKTTFLKPAHRLPSDLPTVSEELWPIALLNAGDWVATQF